MNNLRESIADEIARWRVDHKRSLPGDYGLADRILALVEDERLDRDREIRELLRRCDAALEEAGYLDDSKLRVEIDRKHDESLLRAKKKTRR